MRVSKDDVICGVSAPIARELMRHYYRAHPVEIACDVLGVGQAAARNRLSAFEIAGYLTRDGAESPANDPWWLTTISGPRPGARQSREAHQPGDGQASSRGGRPAYTGVQLGPRPSPGHPRGRGVRELPRLGGRLPR